MSHSKRNTSRPVFTSHERALAKSAWSASSARLSRDSFLTFSSCCLCLELARDPVSCNLGDIFCRECILSNILAQKVEIQRIRKLQEKDDRDTVEAKAREDGESQQRVIRDFELVQAGLEPPSNPSHSKDGHGPTAGIESPQHDNPRKRKLELDDQVTSKIAKDDRTKAKAAIEAEKAAAPTLPSFWSPIVATRIDPKTGSQVTTKVAKTTATCPVPLNGHPHNISLKSLIDIVFAEEADSQSSLPKRVCPICKKALSNTSKAMLARSCGHVVCKGCYDKFLGPTKALDPHDTESNAQRCLVCNLELSKKRSGDRSKVYAVEPGSGMLELRSGGTGFSAGGLNEVKKTGTSFQC